MCVIKKSEIIADSVNRPSHYTVGGIETIDYLRAKLTKEEFAGYCRGNVLKYISRSNHKGGVEDLKKARVYLDWLIDSEVKGGMTDVTTKVDEGISYFGT